MKPTILELFNLWLDYYYYTLDTFCPRSDALDQTANYICEIKQDWSYERALNFSTYLVIR